MVPCRSFSPTSVPSVRSRERAIPSRQALALFLEGPFYVFTHTVVPCRPIRPSCNFVKTIRPENRRPRYECEKLGSPPQLSSSQTGTLHPQPGTRPNKVSFSQKEKLVPVTIGTVHHRRHTQKKVRRAHARTTFKTNKNVPPHGQKKTTGRELLLLRPYNLRYPRGISFLSILTDFRLRLG